MINPELTQYSVFDLQSWQEMGALRISPKFQRRNVWTTPAKGFLIDSVLQSYPIPPIHIRFASTASGQSVREVIDGQQRIRAVFDFIAGDFRIPPSVSPQWGNKSFKTLTESERDTIRHFSFAVYLYKTLSDAEVLDMFSRLNTYSVSLNKQELRNGKWFGHFKQTTYQLATQSLEFWRRHKIFNERQIARMREVELTSELLVAVLDGMQDKKKAIDAFYANLDVSWGSEEVVWLATRTGDSRLQPAEYLSQTVAETRYRDVLEKIDHSMGDILQTTPLHRPALFYTLFCAVYHVTYGLPRGQNLPLTRVGFTSDVGEALRQVAGQLSDLFVDRGRSNNEYLVQFYSGAARQTDNIGPRNDRLHALLNLLEATIRPLSDGGPQ